MDFASEINCSPINLVQRIAPPPPPPCLEGFLQLTTDEVALLLGPAATPAAVEAVARLRFAAKTAVGMFPLVSLHMPQPPRFCCVPCATADGEPSSRLVFLPPAGGVLTPWLPQWLNAERTVDVISASLALSLDNSGRLRHDFSITNCQAATHTTLVSLSADDLFSRCYMSARNLQRRPTLFFARGGFFETIAAAITFLQAVDFVRSVCGHADAEFFVSRITFSPVHNSSATIAGPPPSE